MADALIAPDYKAKGFLDTAVVTIRFDNGAIATAEANFQAVYGYDVRGEVFGSAGMLTMGGLNDSDLVRYLANGIQADTQRMDTDLLRDAYVAELNHFVDCLRTGEKNHSPAVKMPGLHWPLPARVSSPSNRANLCACKEPIHEFHTVQTGDQCRDGLPRSAIHRARQTHSRAGFQRRTLGLDEERHCGPCRHGR